MTGGEMRCTWPAAAISRDRRHQRVRSGQTSGMERGARLETARWPKRTVT